MPPDRQGTRFRLFRTLLSQMAAMPPYPAASALALLIVCGLEVAVLPGQRGALFALYVLGLGSMLGALMGVCWQLGFAITGRLGAKAYGAIWPLATLGAGTALAASLGTFNRLGGQYDMEAKTMLAACLGGSAGLAALLLGMQPVASKPRGAFGAVGRWRRLVLVVGMLASTAVLIYQDHTLYVGLYLRAHVALRLVSVWTLTAALVLMSLPLPRLGKRGWSLIFVLFLVPVTTLNDSRGDALQSFVTRPWPAMVLRIARGILDADRDGFAYLLAGGDCNDFNRSVNPGAREIPANGIDDNCVFGDRKRVVVRPASVPIPTDKAPMNVVLITIDALRQDHVGTYNPAYGSAGLDTMPNLTTWANKATVFDRAYTPGSWTSVAVGAMMRGRYARKLAWTEYFETNQYRMLRRPFDGTLSKKERIVKMFPLAWQDPNKPLSWWLRRRGMKTMAIVDDGFSQMLSRKVGSALGYQMYIEIDPRPQTAQEAREDRKKRKTANDRIGWVGRGDSGTATAGVRAIQRAARGKPFFLWMHFFGPHTPDQRHAGVRRDGTTGIAKYDHELRYVDKHLGRVLDEIDKLEDDTAVFVTSDHGEALMKRYRSHGMDLRESLIRIPFIARVPGWPAGRQSALVSLIDVMPTVMALTHTPAPPYLDGVDLGPVAKGEKTLEERILLSDTWQYRKSGKSARDMVAAYNGRRKVVLHRKDHSYVAYDQQRLDAEPQPIEGWAVDRLVRTMMGYVEETGGTLKVQN